jgi:flagellar hook-associated protein 3
MNVRVTQAMMFDLVSTGLDSNYAKLVRAQQQSSSGKRILAPSDDPVGTALAMQLRQRQSDVDRFLSAAKAAQPFVDEASSVAQDASSAFSSVRELVLQGMNGTLADNERNIVADQVSGLRDQLLELANTQSGDAYLFGGTRMDVPPFKEVTINGKKQVVYQGNDVSRKVSIGLNVSVDTSVPGSTLFANTKATGAQYAGLTGAAKGLTADQGSGFETLQVRHDTTTGTIGAGVAFANGSSEDTILGDRTVEIDGTGSRVRVGNGTWVDVPTAGSANVADYAVKDEHGAEIHLDFSGYTGASASATVHGNGSVSLDGTTWQAIAPGQTNLEVDDPGTGAVLHVNTTGINRAANELVTFGGTANVFDTLQGIIDDLRNPNGAPLEDVTKKLGVRLG